MELSLDMLAVYIDSSRDQIHHNYVHSNHGNWGHNHGLPQGHNHGNWVNNHGLSQCGTFIFSMEIGIAYESFQVL